MREWPTKDEDERAGFGVRLEWTLVATFVVFGYAAALWAVLSWLWQAAHRWL